MPDSAQSLTRRENAAMVALFFVAVIAATVVSFPTGELLVAVPAFVTCVCIAANVKRFGERAWVSSTWASQRGLTPRLFRIAFGGGGSIVWLVGIIIGTLSLVH